MVGEWTPALSAQREFRQTNEGLERNSNEWQETCASEEQNLHGALCTVQRGQNKWT